MKRLPAVVLLAALAAASSACTIYLGDDDDDPWQAPDAGYWPAPDAGYWPPDAGTWQPDAGPWRPDGGSAVDAGTEDGSPGPTAWELAFIDADGTDWAVMLGNTAGQRTRLAAPSYSLQYLAASPVGDQIAVGSFEEGWKLRVLDVSDGSSRLVGRGDLEGPPSWSPDGTQLTYSWRASGADIAPSVVRASVDGSVFEVIEQGRPGSFGCITPSWSPDGREIAYPIADTVRVRTVATGATRTIATGVAEACKPVWSPDGRVLVFGYGGGTGAGSARLALVGARGGPVRNLTSLYSYQSEARPAWSPDGRSLVFTDYDPALPSFALREVSAGGGPAVSLAASAGGAADWSPDGASILFTRWQDGGTLAVWDVATRTARDLGGSTPGYGPNEVSWLAAPIVR